MGVGDEHPEMDQLVPRPGVAQRAVQGARAETLAQQGAGWGARPFRPSPGGRTLSSCAGIAGTELGDELPNPGGLQAQRLMGRLP